MLKKFIFYAVFLIILLIIINLSGKSSRFYQEKKSNQIKATPPPKTIINKKITSSIFVPSWSNLDNLDLKNYDRAIYFSVSPAENGIINSQTEKIESFVNTIDNTKEKWLTLAMTNTDLNLIILKNQKSWKKSIDGSVDLIKKYKFNGLVMDLEISSIAYDETIREVNEFVQTFYTSLKDQNIKFALALYGDTFYRKRPYHLSFLAENSDEIMIMAYDLHKPRGEAGPNFPLTGKEIYGYDLKTMIQDFSKFVSADKLTVIFGMYGYDWTVDEKKRPIKNATAMSLNDIHTKILSSCKNENCVVKRDDLAKETEINYIDQNQNAHIVWFEDEKSVDAKIKYLKTQGIFNFAYWAYSYF